MSRILLSWARYRLFEYEYELAKRELWALGARSVQDVEGGVEVSGIREADLITRSTFFASVGCSEALPTEQASVEDSHAQALARSMNRQETRYGVHGIHEYKGKFNPQLTRALTNIADPEAELLIDPFCGSGTSLIEGLRLGRRVIGIDLSPMAAFMAAAKVGAMSYKRLPVLLSRLSDLSDEAFAAMKEAQDSMVESCVPGLSAESLAYLKDWFVGPVYASLTAALKTVLPHRARAEGRLALVALSSVLREASLQLPEDLRVRRRPPPEVSPNLAELFRSAVDMSSGALQEMTEWPPHTGEASVRAGSAEDMRSYQSKWGSARTQIVTSPPYATALPYIDTDRLSMVALGLLDARLIRKAERDLTGSREWSRGDAIEWGSWLSENKWCLPDSVVGISRRIAHENTTGSVGFRRRDVAPLLYRYFSRMAFTFETWAKVLDPGETAVLVVGANSTVSGTGNSIAIPTPELTADLAESRGFAVVEMIGLETWPRYGIHHKNSVRGESAVILKKAV